MKHGIGWRRACSAFLIACILGGSVYNVSYADATPSQAERSPTPGSTEEAGVSATPGSTEEAGVSATPESTEEAGVSATPGSTEEAGVSATPEATEEVTPSATPEAPAERRILLWTFDDPQGLLTENALILPGPVQPGAEAFGAIAAMLPAQIMAKVDGADGEIPVAITGWACPALLAGEPTGAEGYLFTAALEAGYACAPSPQVRVVPGGAMLMNVMDYTWDANASTLTVHTDAGMTAWQNDAALDREAVAIVVIDSGATAIPQSAFAGLASLREVSIPATVAALGQGAFAGCISLSKVSFASAQAPSLSGNPFEGAPEGLRIHAPDNASGYVGEEASEAWRALLAHIVMAISGQGYTFDRQTGELTVTSGSMWKTDKRFAASDILKLTLKDSVTSIVWEGFANLRNLQEVSLPANLKSMDTYSFLNCASLKRIDLPDGLTKIPWGAFQGCSSLTEVKLPSGLRQIDTQAFHACSALKSISLPIGLEKIGDSAFYMSGLESVDVPDTVKTLGDAAFGQCKSLKQAWLPRQISSIGVNLFTGCSKLTGVSLPENITQIGNLDFDRCALLQQIDIPDTVTAIQNNALNGCSSLLDIRLPNGVTTIGIYALAFTGISSIDIPAAVTKMAPTALYGCGRLRQATFHNATAPSMEGLGADYDYTHYPSSLICRVPKGADVESYTKLLPGATVVSGAALQGIDLSAGSIAFDPNTTQYAFAVDTLTSALSITPTALYAGHAIEIDGEPARSGSAFGPIELSPGATTPITIVVRSDKDPDDARMYTLSVARPALPVNQYAIAGVSVPRRGETPTYEVTETEQYTGKITWEPEVRGSFAADTEYTARIELSAKAGYTLTGVGENRYTVAGAASCANAAGSGEVVARFARTEKAPVKNEEDEDEEDEGIPSVRVEVGSAPGEMTWAVVTMPDRPDGDGEIDLLINDWLTRYALSQARKAAAESGREAYGIGLEIRSASLSARRVRLKLDAQAAGRLEDGDVRGFCLNLPDMWARLNGHALSALGVQGTNGLRMSLEHSGAGLGFLLQDGRGRELVLIRPGAATLGLHYALRAQETAAGLFAHREMGAMLPSLYEDGWLLARTAESLTMYVGHDASAAGYADVAGHPAKDQIEFVCARGWIAPAQEGLFLPDAPITASELLEALYRLGEGEGDREIWAQAMGIASLCSAAPEARPTRAQTAACGLRFLEAMGCSLPQMRTGTPPAGEDRLEVISAWRAGLLDVRPNGGLEPEASCNRADAAIWLCGLSRAYVRGN